MKGGGAVRGGIIQDSRKRSVTHHFRLHRVVCGVLSLGGKIHWKASALVHRTGNVSTCSPRAQATTR